MDPFIELPFPILLEIAKLVPDLESLHSLRGASPVFACLLQEEGLAAEIAESVILSSLTRVNQVTARLTCLVLWQPAPSWPALIEAIRGEVFTLAYTGPLPRDIPAQAVLRLLALAKAAHRAAHRCLHTLIQRCLSVRPQRPVDRKWHYGRQLFWRRYPRGPFELPPHPPGEPADVDVVGVAALPEWVEEQRALDGAWKLALFAVVLDAATDVWSPEDLQLLHSLGAVGTWQDFGKNRLECWDFLDRLETMVDTGTTAQPSTPSPLLSLCEAYSFFPESPWPCCAARPMDATWNPAPSGEGASRCGYSFFRIATTRPFSPLRTIDFGPFRALGFSLWEERRLVAMGVLGDRSIGSSSFSSNLYAWKSLLTLEQLDELEASQRRAWPIPENPDDEF